MSPTLKRKEERAKNVPGATSTGGGARRGATGARVGDGCPEETADDEDRTETGLGAAFAEGEARVKEFVGVVDELVGVVIFAVTGVIWLTGMGVLTEAIGASGVVEVVGAGGFVGVGEDALGGCCRFAPSEILMC